MMNHTSYNHDNRCFAFCHSCYWTATILTRLESYECPLCPGKKVDLIPLNLDEKYEYDLDPTKS